MPLVDNRGVSRWTHSALTLIGGGVLAATPTAILAISSHTFSLPEQAAVVVAVAVATFAAQVISAVTVEAELASRSSPESLRAPRWLAVCGLLSCLLLAVFASSFAIVSIALVPIFAALESGRVAAVAARRDRHELLASTLFLLALCLGVGAAIGGATWAFAPVALGAGAVIVVRSLPTWMMRHTAITSITIRSWLGIDAIAAGATFPIVATVAYSLGGDAVTAVFGMVASVSAIAALPASYLKMRLLGEHSRGEVLLSVTASVAAVAAVLAAQGLGVFNLVFGETWSTGVTVAILALACVWRALSLLTVIPFASLRRHGRVRRMVPVRVVAAAITLVLVLIAAPLGVFALFAVLSLSELLTAAGYWLADRWRSRLAKATI